MWIARRSSGYYGRCVAVRKARTDHQQRMARISNPRPHEPMIRPDTVMNTVQPQHTPARPDRRRYLSQFLRILRKHCLVHELLRIAIRTCNPHRSVPESDTAFRDIPERDEGELAASCGRALEAVVRLQKLREKRAVALLDIGEDVRYVGERLDGRIEGSEDEVLDVAVGDDLWANANDWERVVEQAVSDVHDPRSDAFCGAFAGLVGEGAGRVAGTGTVVEELVPVGFGVD